MGDVLAYIEHRDGSFRSAAREAVAAAASIARGSGAVHALALGPVGLSDATEPVRSAGASRIRLAEHADLARYDGGSFAEIVTAEVRAGAYDAVVFAATAEGRDLAPRVAALLDVPLASDVTELSVDDGKLVLTRPVFAGKLFARVVLQAKPALLSIRPNVFQAVADAREAEVQAFTPQLGAGSPRTRVLEFKAAEGGALDVSEATIVVSGGRGMKGPENWHILEDLRDAIGDGAALGASRAVVDAGWRPHGEQVGQTGKTVSPKLYFAVGISGAIQHLAGMRTAQTIVAVNKDPDAPIFRVADYGIVGDVLEIVPRLAREIRSLRAGG
jgi:electron transfer flavoprotein alpha subunit